MTLTLTTPTAKDVESGPVQTLGLKQASENFAKLAGPIKDTVGRSSSLSAALVLNRAVKAATYSTFRRVTGFVREGFAVRVARQLTPDGELDAFVVQRPQDITGHNEVAKAFRVRYLIPRYASKRSVSIEPQIAFWWRFLEFGTGVRFSKSKPKFLKRGLAPKTRRDWRSIRAFAASGNRGQIQSRSWIRPARASSEHQAVSTFADRFRQGVETEVERLPK